MSEMTIPNSWVSTTLETICLKITDGSHNPPKPCSEGKPMISAKNIVGGKILFGEGYRLISEDGFELEAKRTRIKPNDILLTIVGALGRSAIVPSNIQEFTLQRSVAVLSSRYCDTKFIKYSLDAPTIQHYIVKNAKGTAQKGIYLNQLKQLPLSIPSISEQQEIVRQLDVMLAQVEQIKARLDAIPAILKKFRQSVLADAVSGKLLEQDTHFTAYKLSKISEFQNGYAFKSNWFTKEGDHQVIKLGNIRDDFLYIENAPSFVGVEVSNQFKKFKPNVGDLLISMTGTRFKKDYGYVCQVREDSNLLINQRVGRIIPNTKFVNSSYLLLCLRSDLFRQEFFKGETGGVNQGNVGSKHIEQIELNIPSVECQNRVVELTDALFRSVENIDVTTQAVQKRVNLLTQSILAKAFSGELTAEWRTQHQDLITGVNSAEALLAKIQSKREASKPVKNTRKKKEV